MIVIIDIGMGNLNSILNMLRKIKVEALISSNINDIEKADKLILPGVGAFDTAMGNINRIKIRKILDKKVLQDKTPILGICLGMQILTKTSEEGKSSGLGWIDAETVRFNFQENMLSLKIPHMGWNTVDVQNDSPLFHSLDNGSKFYFVHSYYAVCRDKKDVIAKTTHGYPFDSSIGKGNIYGTQFHPEKSHRYGMQLIDNFARLC